jgi:hypothetical protein
LRLGLRASLAALGIALATFALLVSVPRIGSIYDSFWYGLRGFIGKQEFAWFMGAFALAVPLAIAVAGTTFLALLAARRLLAAVAGLALVVLSLPAGMELGRMIGAPVVGIGASQAEVTAALQFVGSSVTPLTSRPLIGPVISDYAVVYGPALLPSAVAIGITLALTIVMARRRSRVQPAPA